MSRRRLMINAATAFGGLALAPAALRAEPGFALPASTERALAASRLVYVSPLAGSGAESRCHGEVWYSVDAGAVVIVTALDRWKAVAIRKGRDRARLWVGDFGPVKQAGERYRAAPSFLARAEIVKERAVFDRLLEAFSRRYSAEWGKWKPRFENGYADGSRVVIRYAPIGA